MAHWQVQKNFGRVVFLSLKFIFHFPCKNSSIKITNEIFHVTYRPESRIKLRQTSLSGDYHDIFIRRKKNTFTFAMRACTEESFERELSWLCCLHSRVRFSPCNAVTFFCLHRLGWKVFLRAGAGERERDLPRIDLELFIFRALLFQQFNGHGAAKNWHLRRNRLIEKLTARRSKNFYFSRREKIFFFS